MEYPIWNNGIIAGTAAVTTAGLYREILCRCRDLPPGIHRVSMAFSDRRILVGVLIPEGGVYQIRRKIPTKEFGSGEPSFDLGTEVLEEKCMLLEAGKPIKDPGRLRYCKLRLQDGKAYLVD